MTTPEQRKRQLKKQVLIHIPTRLKMYILICLRGTSAMDIGNGRT